MSDNTVINIVPNSDAVVVLIHGLSEGVQALDEFVPLFTSLGISSVKLSLPGHGMGLWEFAHSTLEQWEKYVTEEVEKLRHQFDHIFLMGRSMGALLAITESANCSKNIDGVISIAPPFRVWLTYKEFKQNLVSKSEVLNNSPEVKAMVQKMGFERRYLWQYFVWIPQVIDLIKLVRKTKRVMPYINVPILAIQSTNDTVVPLSCIKVMSRLNPMYVKPLVLTNSTHYYYPHNDFEFIKLKITSFTHNRLAAPEHKEPHAKNGATRGRKVVKGNVVAKKTKYPRAVKK